MKFPTSSVLKFQWLGGSICSTCGRTKVSVSWRIKDFFNGCLWVSEVWVVQLNPRFDGVINDFISLQFYTFLCQLLTHFWKEYADGMNSQIKGFFQQCSLINISCFFYPCHQVNVVWFLPTNPCNFKKWKLNFLYGSFSFFTCVDKFQNR